MEGRARRCGRSQELATLVLLSIAPGRGYILFRLFVAKSPHVFFVVFPRTMVGDFAERGNFGVSRFSVSPHGISEMQMIHSLSGLIDWGQQCVPKKCVHYYTFAHEPWLHLHRTHEGTRPDHQARNKPPRTWVFVTAFRICLGLKSPRPKSEVFWRSFTAVASIHVLACTCVNTALILVIFKCTNTIPDYFYRPLAH